VEPFEPTPRSGPRDRIVGPVLVDGALSDAVVAALRLRNEGLSVRGEGAYVRAECAERCVLRCDDVEAILGEPFLLPQSLDAIMLSFSGKLHIDRREANWVASQR